MKRIVNAIYVLAGLVLLGALTLWLVSAFQALGSPETAGALAKTPQGYPPPKWTVIVPTSVPNIEPPTPTFPPVPSPLPTPVVTVVPLSELPITSLPTANIDKLYTIVIRDGNLLRTINSNGTNERVVVDVHAQTSLFIAPMGSQFWGSPSPDGKRLALVLSNVAAVDNLPQGRVPRYSIYVLDLLTSQLQPLVQDGAEPKWSPDGNSIAYRSTQTHGLRVVDTNTGSVREIYPVDRMSSDYWVHFLTWSPNSKKIAFVEATGELETGGLWVVDVFESGRPVQLVPEEMQAANISWSPAGDQILFVSDAGKHLTPERPLSVWVVDSKTGQQQQLTRDITTSGGTPTWSPDGNWIAFTGVNLLEGGELPYDLWLIARDGSNLKRLTKDSASDLYASWVFGSNTIVFKKRGAGLWELSLDTGTFKQIYAQEVDYMLIR